MVCLPELWEEVNYDELDWLLNHFTNFFSFYAFLIFLHKYVEIDSLDLVFNHKLLSKSTKVEIRDHLMGQYLNLYKDEFDIEILEKGLIGVDADRWRYIKQVFLLDDRIKPVTMEPQELKNYLDTISF